MDNTSAAAERMDEGDEQNIVEQVTQQRADVKESKSEQRAKQKK